MASPQRTPLGERLNLPFGPSNFSLKAHAHTLRSLGLGRDAAIQKNPKRPETIREQPLLLIVQIIREGISQPQGT